MRGPTGQEADPMASAGAYLWNTTSHTFERTAVAGWDQPTAVGVPVLMVTGQLGANSGSGFNTLGENQRTVSRNIANRRVGLAKRNSERVGHKNWKFLCGVGLKHFSLRLLRQSRCATEIHARSLL